MRLPLLGGLALVAACAPRNPPVPPPDSSELQRGGVWIAYNYGCDRGCDQIQRGDRITAIDGTPVATGPEVDAARLTDGLPHRIDGLRHGDGAPFTVTLVARPRDDMPPLVAVDPLRTIGAEALDRAPAWARRHHFGHAIPAFRVQREEPPRGWMNGRQLHLSGRGALMLVWIYGGNLPQRERLQKLAPVVYAQLQAAVPALIDAGVDPLFIVDHNTSPTTRAALRSRVDDPRPGYVPVLRLSRNAADPNTLGLEGSAADLHAGLFGLGAGGPAILVVDPRGIVRWHSAGLGEDPAATLGAAIDFALTDLPDRPDRPDRPASAPALPPPDDPAAVPDDGR